MEDTAVSAKMVLRSYRDLRAWQEAIKLVEMVYGLTRTMPQEERYGLCSQMQRASVSVPSNIAEGYGRDHRKEYVHHLSISKGSLAELETLVIISEKLCLLSREAALSVWQQAQLTGRLLRALAESLKGCRNSVVRTRDPRPETPDPNTNSAGTKPRRPTGSGRQKE